jgi:hypothetical protein
MPQIVMGINESGGTLLRGDVEAMTPLGVALPELSANQKKMLGFPKEACLCLFVYI